MGGAWLCVQLYDHYDYGRSLAFLKTLYPLMKGACQFFLDTLVPHPKFGWMINCPTMSPENTHPYGSMLVAGTAMDSQILRDLFARTAAAAKALKTDTAFAAAVEAMRKRLPPDQIGKAGQLQEWLEDWDMEVPEIHHRHISHLYALFPSAQINRFDTPALAAAAKKTLEIRGDEATGWGTAWRINWWARLGDGDHAYRILKFLTGPERTYPNLFDAHPPFQIDGNFGGANAITEMLLQSWDDDALLLPALPAAWPSGRVSGLRARGGIVADLSWQNGALADAHLTAAADRHVRLRYRGTELATTLKAGRPLVLTDDGGKLVTLKG
jgi:alpha-L-fucosidase 2